MAATKTAVPVSSNNLVIILLLVTLLVVGVSALVAKALITSITLDTKVVTAKNLAKKQLTDDLAAAPNLVNAYAALGAQAGTLADALPTTSDFPALMVEMENIATDAGVKLKSIQPAQATATADASAGATSGDASTAPAPQTYSFVISFDGSYAALQRLVGDVEMSGRPMRITGMQLNGSGQSLTAELDIDTYFQGKADLPIGQETIK